MRPDQRFDEHEPNLDLVQKLKQAWRELEEGNADRAQGKLILEHLASLTGYYNGMSLTTWLQDTGSTDGYQTACMEHQARRWVFSEILPFLNGHPDGRAGATTTLEAMTPATASIWARIARKLRA